MESTVNVHTYVDFEVLT